MRNIYLFCLGIFLIQAAAAQSSVSRPKVNHTAIYVVNLKTSAAFYENVLGLEVMPEPFHDGKHAWFRIGRGVELHIIAGATSKKEYYKNQHTCFSVASVEAFTEILRKNNITWEDVNGVKNAITTRPDGVKQFWLQDPDSYWLEINDAKE